MDHLDRARTDPSARRAAALAASRTASRTFSEALRGARPAAAGARASSPRSTGRPAGGAASGPAGTGDDAAPSRGLATRPPSAARLRRGGPDGEARPVADARSVAEAYAPRAGQPAEIAPGRADAATDAGETAALRAAVRALPVAAETFRARGSGAVALELGRALSVELRSATGGVEILLRPEASLSRVAAGELPGLVQALRARGIAVASAAVRARPGRG